MLWKIIQKNLFGVNVKVSQNIFSNLVYFII